MDVVRSWPSTCWLKCSPRREMAVLQRHVTMPMPCGMACADVSGWWRKDVRSRKAVLKRFLTCFLFIWNEYRCFNDIEREPFCNAVGCLHKKGATRLLYVGVIFAFFYPCLSRILCYGKVSKCGFSFSFSLYVAVFYGFCVVDFYLSLHANFFRSHLAIDLRKLTAQRPVNRR